MHSNSSEPQVRPAHFDDQQRLDRAAWLASMAGTKPRNSGTLGAAVSAMIAVAIGAIAADWATGEVIATQLASLLFASL